MFELKAKNSQDHSKHKFLSKNSLLHSFPGGGQNYPPRHLIAENLKKVRKTQKAVRTETTGTSNQLYSLVYDKYSGYQLRINKAPFTETFPLF